MEEQDYGEHTISDGVPHSHFVHHVNGEIICREFTNSPQTIPGATRIEVEIAHPPETHKIIVDPVFGAIITEKTAAEQRHYQLPRRHEVQSLILQELTRSDKTQVSDFPIAEAMRDKWRVYRQALRDLSKQYTNHLDQIQNWPPRPDNADPIAHLRARLTPPA